MARIDDYHHALDLAAARLRHLNIHDLAIASGFRPGGAAPEDPLKNVSRNRPEALLPAGTELGGQAANDGDVSMQFRVLPRVPLKLILIQIPDPV